MITNIQIVLITNMQIVITQINIQIIIQLKTQIYTLILIILTIKEITHHRLIR
jgi:hypothetical protein